MLERSALRANTEINRPAKAAGPEAPGTPQWHGGPDPLRRAPAAEASAADLVTRVLEYAVVTRASTFTSSRSSWRRSSATGSTGYSTR